MSALHAALPDYSYVMKTDVKHYYDSIDHTILLKQQDKDITGQFIWRLLVQFVKRSFTNKKSIYPIGRCFLMIIDDVGLHGFMQAFRRR